MKKITDEIRDNSNYPFSENLVFCSKHTANSDICDVMDCTDCHVVPVKSRLKMREFRITVLHNPPVYMINLGLDSVREETITIKGYTLKDAKKRAGIQ